MAVPAHNYVKPLTFRVRNPATGEVQTLSYPNARDVVKHSKWEWVNTDEKEVLKVARVEAEKRAFVDGNDPTKLDVDALVAQFKDNLTQVVPSTVDDMTKPELLALADAEKIEVDKRHGQSKIADTIKAAMAKKAADEAALEGPDSTEQRSGEQDGAS